MYTSLYYAGGLPAGTISTFISDIVKVLTGETDVNNLSAGVSRTRSIIDTSVRAAGWTVHDAAAGTNGTQVIKAPVADNASQYKYVRIQGGSANAASFSLFETWNATTHTGTNSTPGCVVGDSGNNYTGPMFVHISSSVRHMAICHHLNSLTSIYPMVGVFEHTRTTWNDTVANGYLPAVSTGNVSVTQSAFGSSFVGASGAGVQAWQFTRILNNVATAGTPTDVTAVGGCLVLPTGPCVASGTVMNGTSHTSGNSAVYNKVIIKQVTLDGTQTMDVFVPFGVNNSYFWWLGGDISNYADIWLTTLTYGNPFELKVKDGNNYVLWPNGSHGTLAVRKG